MYCPVHVGVFTIVLTIKLQDYIDLSLRQSRLSYQRARHFAFCKYVHSILVKSLALYVRMISYL